MKHLRKQIASYLLTLILIMAGIVSLEAWKGFWHLAAA